MNAPPSNGKCIPSLKNGRALIDRFEISCKDWLDEHQPLSYKFEMLKTKSDDEKESKDGADASAKDKAETNEEAGSQGNTRLLYHGSNDTVSLVLPLGDKALNYLLPLKIAILDFYGSATEVTLNLTVSDVYVVGMRLITKS